MVQLISDMSQYKFYRDAATWAAIYKNLYKDDKKNDTIIAQEVLADTFCYPRRDVEKYDMYFMTSVTNVEEVSDVEAGGIGYDYYDPAASGNVQKYANYLMDRGYVKQDKLINISVNGVTEAYLYFVNKYDDSSVAMGQGDGYIRVIASAVKESEDMLNKCLLMDAKEKMDKGHLNQAKAVLEQLPSDCSYKKVKAGSLLKKINKYKDFLPICGYWTTSDMKSMIMQTSKTTGSWNSWEGNTSGQHLLITCSIGDDGRVTITASVDYWVYTNFSVLSSNLKTKDSVKFLIDVTDKLPDKIVGDDSSLTLSPGNFNFEFNLVDPNASLNFDYTWNCTATFTELKEAY